MKYLKLIPILMILFALSCSKKTTEPTILVVNEPEFSPGSGVYEIGQTVTIHSSTTGAEMRYTLDGTEPSVESALYISPLILPTIFSNNANYVTIKAKAYKEGYEPSPTVAETFSVHFANTVSTPETEQVSGLFTNTFSVIVTCDTPGAEIRYTTDGSEPDYLSPLYTTPVEVYEQETTLKAKAYKATWNASGTLTRNYILKNYVAGQYQTDNNIHGIYIEGNYAYLANCYAGLKILDISNPETPVLAGEIDTYDATDIAFSGNYAYIADSNENGVKVFDISSPHYPDYLTHIDTPGQASDIKISGNIACIADEYWGLRIFNISDISNPDAIGFIETPGACYEYLAIKDDYAYVCGNCNVKIIRLDSLGREGRL